MENNLKPGQKVIMEEPSNNKHYVGFCENASHTGFITLEIANQHNCFGKECEFFTPNLENYLYQRENFNCKQIPYKHLARIKDKIDYKAHNVKWLVEEDVVEENNSLDRDIFESSFNLHNIWKDEDDLKNYVVEKYKKMKVLTDKDK